MGHAPTVRRRNAGDRSEPLHAGAPRRSSQHQYGARAGLPRILKLLDASRIPATWIKASGRHEFAVHGWIHELNATLPDSTERMLLQRAVAELK